jgi:hypothetical protein
LVAAALAQGQLDDRFVTQATESGDRRSVVYALAELAQVSKSVVERILISQSGKAITALAWQAKLAMRTAVAIQSAVVRLPNHKIVMARDGVDYPLPADEMRWHLSFFDVGA